MIVVVLVPASCLGSNAATGRRFRGSLAGLSMVGTSFCGEAEGESRRLRRQMLRCFERVLDLNRRKATAQVRPPAHADVASVFSIRMHNFASILIGN